MLATRLSLPSEPIRAKLSPMKIAILLGAVAFFGLAHSLTAGHRLKALILRILGNRAYYSLYRLLYNLLAVLTLAPALLAIALLPTVPYTSSVCPGPSR